MSETIQVGDTVKTVYEEEPELVVLALLGDLVRCALPGELHPIGNFPLDGLTLVRRPVKEG